MFHWMNFLTYAVITAATPGPNNLMSLSNAGRLGFKRSFPLNLGIWAGFTAVMLLCTALSSTFHNLLPAIKAPMLCIGAGYMLYLAYKTWKSPALAEGGPQKTGFLPGCLLQFINPKIYIYCIVSMEAYILPCYQGRTAALVGFALLLSTIGFAFTLCWALFGSLFKLLFSRYAKATNRIMALLLVYCALSLFF